MFNMSGAAGVELPCAWAVMRRSEGAGCPTTAQRDLGRGLPLCAPWGLLARRKRFCPPPAPRADPGSLVAPCAVQPGSACLTSTRTCPRVVLPRRGSQGDEPSTRPTPRCPGSGFIPVTSGPVSLLCVWDLLLTPWGCRAHHSTTLQCSEHVRSHGTGGTCQRYGNSASSALQACGGDPGSLPP